MLSLPPTPGQSIIRRPNSDGIFNLGTVFSEKGYRTQFVYGGYAYFDNMKEWFSGNGFEGALNTIPQQLTPIAASAPAGSLSIPT